MADIETLNGTKEDDCLALARRWAQAARHDPPPSGEFLADDLDRIANEIERLREVVHFYADPQSYHAIAFFVDRPAGSFADDFSEDDETRAHGYNRPMPGKLAREALPAE